MLPWVLSGIHIQHTILSSWEVCMYIIYTIHTQISISFPFIYCMLIYKWRKNSNINSKTVASFIFTWTIINNLWDSLYHGGEWPLTTILHKRDRTSSLTKNLSQDNGVDIHLQMCIKILNAYMIHSSYWHREDYPLSLAHVPRARSPPLSLRTRNE
jgi:hypothetical protein